jgi:Peptidase_C39 like family
MPVASALLTANLVVFGLAVGAPTPPSDSVPALDVPFIAQGPLLCGGAAAAMVERYWGARGVYAEDFAGLVRAREGGIRAADLVASLADRGYIVRVYENDPAALPRELQAGVPVIVLLNGGEPVLHYVVVVGWSRSRVWINDPAYGPARPLSRAELMKRWVASNDWALVVRPGAKVGQLAASANDGDPATAPLAQRGIQQLRQGDYDAARRTARGILAHHPGAPLGWRLLATARYLDGDHLGALRAWNRVGEPRLDLLRIEGLHHTRYAPVERMLGLRHGAVLTEAGLAVARRRLRMVPALSLSHLDYQPLADGSVEATAAVLEQATWPTGRVAVATLAAEAALDRRAVIQAGPLLGAGDRWTLAAQWDPALAVARFRVQSLTPPLPGLVGVTLDWRRARLAKATGEPRLDERLDAGVDIEHWLSGQLRLDGSLGVDRWRGIGKLAAGSVGAEVQLADRLRLHASVQGWAGGSSSFGRLALRLKARVPQGPHQEWRLDAGAAAASSTAPPLAWWGAGTGRIGDILLRGHPLVRAGAIRGPAFGRDLVHASVEHIALWRVGPARLGGAVFLDAARAWRTTAARETPIFVDFGAGLRASLGERNFRLDLARGGADWVLSAQVGSWTP